MTGKETEITGMVTLEEGILDPDQGRDRDQGQEKGGQGQLRRDMKE